MAPQIRQSRWGGAGRPRARREDRARGDIPDHPARRARGRVPQPPRHLPPAARKGQPLDYASEDGPAVDGPRGAARTGPRRSPTDPTRIGRWAPGAGARWRRGRTATAGSASADRTKSRGLSRPPRLRRPPPVIPLPPPAALIGTRGKTQQRRAPGRPSSTSRPHPPMGTLVTREMSPTATTGRRYTARPTRVRRNPNGPNVPHATPATALTTPTAQTGGTAAVLPGRPSDPAIPSHPMASLPLLPPRHGPSLP